VLGGVKGGKRRARGGGGARLGGARSLRGGKGHVDTRYSGKGGEAGGKRESLTLPPVTSAWADHVSFFHSVKKERDGKAMHHSTRGGEV